MQALFVITLILAALVVLVPMIFMVGAFFRTVVAAFRNTDPALEDAARSLGRRPLAVLLGVTLRQARPAAVGGSLLVALYALSDFGAVSIMRYESLTHALYRSYRASFDRTPAAVLGCVLVALAVVLLVAQRRRGPDRVARVAGGAPRTASRVPLGRWRWPAAAKRNCCTKAFPAPCMVQKDGFMAWRGTAGSAKKKAGVGPPAFFSRTPTGVTGWLPWPPWRCGT